MGLAGAERIFKLMDEAPEEDHGVVTLVNVSYDKSGSQLEESEIRTNLWAWKVPHGVGATMVPVRTQEDGSLAGIEKAGGGLLLGMEIPSDGEWTILPYHSGTCAQRGGGELLPDQALR